MRRSAWLLTLIACTTAAAATADEFRLPEGLVIEKVAGPPLVDRPITAAFDEEGRLYVADSSGSNDPVEKQLAEKPHRIVRLEDSDGDGKFDRRTVYADRMMFPEGTMWLDGSLYVAAPPQIWKLTDTDDDGIADRREVWFDGKTLTGCANDLHGPYLGPDGWIYWCKGAFAKQTYERPGKSPFVTRAAHIFRARPDGTGIEPVMTGGMDNPVDVVFTREGEPIFTTTFFVHPGGGERDGLIHALYGGIYGKIHDPIFDPVHKWTGPEVLPPLVHLGPAAPCGLVRYESTGLGSQYRDNLFACSFNLHKVTRHVLKLKGATFEATTEDFLTSDNVDFHPTDIIEDADGSLIVLDTGGWYKLCCPTSALHKPDVLGAIYRIRRADVRPVMRRESGESPLWSDVRRGGPEALARLREALDGPSREARLVALRGVSLWRDREAVPALIRLLASPDLHSRRIAAEALGRIGDESAVAPLLTAAAEPNDRALEHAITYALIEIADPAATAGGLSSASPGTRRAALVALDQMDGGGLKAETVAPLLASEKPALREAAAWIVGRHPEWGDALAGFLRERLYQGGLDDAGRAELESQLARFARSGTVQTLLAEALRDDRIRASALRAVARAKLKETPTGWLEGVREALAAPDPETRALAVAAARALARPEGAPDPLGDALRAVGMHEANDDILRLNALAAISGGLREAPPEMFDFLLDALREDRPVAVRGAACEVLSRARLTSSQLLKLAETIRTVGPLEVGKLLTAFEESSEPAIGRVLVASLIESPALGSLRVETLRPVLDRYGPEVKPDVEALYARIDAGLREQHAKVEALLTALSAGDVRRGHAVFHGAKAACSSCHAIGYVGGKVGPDLTRIGQIRTERDLLEAIVAPSASFVRSYEPVAVATTDGRVVSGLLTSDAADEVVITTSATETVRIPRAEIEEMRPAEVSVMPAGLDQQLTPQELADLVAFLKACK